MSHANGVKMIVLPALLKVSTSFPSFLTAVMLLSQLLGVGVMIGFRVLLPCISLGILFNTICVMLKYQARLSRAAAFVRKSLTLHHFQQGESNRVSERKIKDFSFTYSQETCFLAVVQDGK
ncbi:MAG: hypothetical protein HC862_11130 [Scytonema sp. RU_4_4]|nr:hypothetical protein [Scytonema sp. RU_4_4]